MRTQQQEREDKINDIIREIKSCDRSIARRPYDDNTLSVKIRSLIELWRIEKNAIIDGNKITAEYILATFLQLITMGPKNALYLKDRAAFYLELRDISSATTDLEEARTVARNNSADIMVLASLDYFGEKLKSAESSQAAAPSVQVTSRVEVDESSTRNVGASALSKVNYEAHVTKKASFQAESATAASAPDQTPATSVSVPSVESKYLKYAEIKAIIDEIEYLNDGIKNQPNVHFVRAKKLIELWEMKKNGFYPGELSIDHVLKSLNIAVDVAIKETDKEYEEDSLLLRCMFYANEGDKTRALHDLNRAKTFSVSSDLIRKGYIASKIDKAEAKINALFDVQLSDSTTEAAPTSYYDMASFIREIEIQELRDKIALADMIPPTSSEYQNVERIKAEAQSRLAKMQTTTAQVPAMTLPAAEKPLVHMQASAVTPAKLSAVIKSPQRNYDDIQRASNRISEIDERIFNKHASKNCHWQRTSMLIELWNEKKAGHYLGELSAEHILKSFTTVIMQDANDPTYWVKRGNFYAQLGDRVCALSDYEKAKSLPAPESVLAAFCYNNELTDLERAISALPTTGTTQGQSRPLAPLTIDEIKIQKFQREIALFDMQLEMTPNHAESFISKAYAFSQLAGLLQWETSVAEKVTRAYDAAIQCAPNAYLYLRRAGSHLKKNNFSSALQDIYIGTQMLHQPNMQETILKYINAILIGNYKSDAGLQNAFERFRVEKNIPEITVEAWFNTLSTKYQPVVIENPAQREIRLLQQQIQAQNAEISALRTQVGSLQTGLGGRAALFAKCDAQTQTVTNLQTQAPVVQSAAL